MSREYYLYQINHYADSTPEGGGIEITFADYNFEGPRLHTVILHYDRAFDFLDALAEELGQTLLENTAYVFTPDWDEPHGEVIALDDFRPDKVTAPSPHKAKVFEVHLEAPETPGCDGRCINCQCGYYESPAEPPRLANRWKGDAHGKHHGNDVY